MSTIESDLDALAAAVRFFTDQEIPNVTQWNVDPNVLKQSLTRIGDGFTTVETNVANLAETVGGITQPDGSLAPISEWVDETGTPAYVSATSFTLPGDRTTTYRPGHRLQATIAGGSKVVVTVQSLTFSPGTNATTFVLTTASLDSALSKIAYSIVRQSSPAARTEDILDLAVTGPKLGALAVTTPKLADTPNGVAVGKMNDNAVNNRVLANDAVSNLKVLWKSLQGSERIADGSINGSVSLTPGSVTGDRIAANQLNQYHLQANSVHGGHVIDKSLWAASELADYSVAWHSIARGHVRGSWSGAQNEIGQKTIWGASDIADNSIVNGLIYPKTIWINDRCADKSMLGYNSIVDYSINLPQINHSQTTAAGVQAGLNSGGAWTGWRGMGRVQFNLGRYGWVRIYADLCGFIIETTQGGGAECWFRILQNGSLVMQRHYLSMGNGNVSQFSPSMQYIGWWGPGGYDLYVDCYFGYAYGYVYDGVINATQEA